MATSPTTTEDQGRLLEEALAVVRTQSQQMRVCRPAIPYGHLLMLSTEMPRDIRQAYGRSQMRVSATNAPYRAVTD